LCERIEIAINFGLQSDRSVGFLMGFNAKMSELHAAAGLAVLDEFDDILETRRRAAAAIRGQSAAGLQWQSGCERSSWQFVPVAFRDQRRRASAIAACQDRIEVRTYYKPLHEMELFRNWPTAGGDLACTRELCGRLLCLPMANDLTDPEIEMISAVLRSEQDPGKIVSREPVDLSA
jgi:dTDP-4-amino-4,6-dideoxygalactose transaminase